MIKIILLLLLILFSMSFLLVLSSSKIEIPLKSEIIRKPVFAGSFYPQEKLELRTQIKYFFKNSENLKLGNVKAVIVPHAGYEYSGQVAADSFAKLNKNYDNVFVLGPSHQYPLKDISVIQNQYSTPLGKIKKSEKIKSLLKEDIVKEILEAHEKEHAIEVELPFLQEKLKNFKLIPIIVGETDSEELKNLLSKNFGEKDLIVVSVDFSHYHNYSKALQLDSESIDYIMNLDSEGIFQAEIDAPWAVSSLLKLAKEKNWIPYFISYANSGDITGDKTSVVGYNAIVFVEKQELTKEQKFLLNLSRKTLENYYETGDKLKINEKEIPISFKKKKACFVTLTKNNQLRGCIGDMLPEKKLYECVIDNSINAAVNDPRFSPVSRNELDNLKIEISVLTKPKKLKYKNTDELLQKIKRYKHGLIIKQGFYQATYLPTVWKLIPNKILFLESLCNKGNMQKDCWKSSTTEIYNYESKSFEEE